MAGDIPYNKRKHYNRCRPDNKPEQTDYVKLLLDDEDHGLLDRIREDWFLKRNSEAVRLAMSLLAGIGPAEYPAGVVKRIRNAETEYGRWADGVRVMDEKTVLASRYISRYLHLVKVMGELVDRIEAKDSSVDIGVIKEVLEELKSDTLISRDDMYRYIGRCSKDNSAENNNSNSGNSEDVTNSSVCD